MAVFTYIPDWGPAPDLQPRVLKAQFGDGYDQRAADGLNDLLPKWSLTFSKRTQTEATAIADWFKTNRAHVTAFEWVPSNETGTLSNVQFGTGDGTRNAWQLTDGTVGITSGFGTPTIYRTDWQGQQQLYSTARTNLLVNPLFTGGDGWAPATWSAPFRTGTSAPTASIYSGAPGTAYIQSATTQRPYFTESTGTLSIGATYCLSMLVEAVAGGLAATSAMFIGSTPAGATLAWPVCSANPSGGAAGVLVPGVLICLITIGSTAGTAQIRLGVGSAGAATGSLTFSHPQFETGTARTSFTSVTVTDYSISSTGLVTFGQVPLTGAALTWSGSYTRKYIADKWTPARPDDYGSWSVTANLRRVPA